MEPIKTNTEAPADNKPKTVGDVIERSNSVKQRIARRVMNHTGIIFGIFIILVVIVVFTTDIKLTSATEWAGLGLSFFVLLMCSYSMYINGMDSGSRAGKTSSTYTKSNTDYDDLKKKVVDKKIQDRLSDFCRHYVDEELRSARTSILTDVGLTYEQYEKQFIGRDRSSLEEFDLSKTQIKAILEANSVKPIRLTQEMIMRRGRGSARRSPLGTTPKTKKRIHFGTRFIKIFFTSFLTSLIVLEAAINPSWASFAACLLKLFPVVLNGFTGYKTGYENVVVDTVNYMNDQADLLQQFIHYVEQNPVHTIVDETEDKEQEREITTQSEHKENDKAEE